MLMMIQVCVTGSGANGSAGGRQRLKGGARSLDAFEASVLALNLPASQAGVNYNFSPGSYICVPNLYSSTGMLASVRSILSRVLACMDATTSCHRLACNLNRTSSSVLSHGQSCCTWPLQTCSHVVCQCPPFSGLCV